jgi:4-hydroxy-4-methyl-2-oxoglutarate aldolase
MNRIQPYLLCLAFCLPQLLTAQSVVPTEAQLQAYTQAWEGPRYPDGRPKAPDDLLARLEKVSIEEAWGVMRGKGYHNQFVGGFSILHPEEVMVGRALTVQYLPQRPDYHERMEAYGTKEEGRIGAMNSWPIDMLQQGDVYVADCFGKIVDGTLIGDNLGNSIYTNSGNGVVFDAGARDLEGLQEIEGFNAWVRGWDPSFLQGTMLAGINHPIRIGTAVVFPGDVVLAKTEGVIFIPPHLLETVVISAEFIMLRDKFGIMRLREGTYTPGQIDGKWSDEIKEDFLAWVTANEDSLPMTRAELDEYLKGRTW